MSRPRKPTAVLELNGAFDKNPNRRRPNEPAASGPLGDPPGRLSLEQVAFWDELVSIAPPGVLMNSDRWAVEMAACLMEKSTRRKSAAVILELARESDMSTDEIKELARAETINSAELATLRSLLASLGMTPADRSKLSVAQEKPKSKFADLAREAQGFAPRPN